MNPLIVFDGDDTLWGLEILYDQARDAAGAIVASAGLDATEWDALQRSIDLANVQTHGLSAERFPRSCRMAYEVLCERAGRPVDPSTLQQVDAAARSVFESVAEIHGDAVPVLEALEDGADLVLLTKGDESVQRKRVADSGLATYFDEVRIVDSKTSETFTNLASDYGRAPQECWSVGNSLGSDINPAVAAGWNAVWIDAHVWAHERREREPANNDVIVLERLGQLPRALASQWAKAGSQAG